VAFDSKGVSRSNCSTRNVAQSFAVFDCLIVRVVIYDLNRSCIGDVSWKPQLRIRQCRSPCAPSREQWPFSLSHCQAQKDSKDRGQGLRFSLRGREKQELAQSQGAPGRGVRHRWVHRARGSREHIGSFCLAASAAKTCYFVGKVGTGSLERRSTALAKLSDRSSGTARPSSILLGHGLDLARAAAGLRRSRLRSGPESKLRQPVFGRRDDKRPSECVLPEVYEVIVGVAAESPHQYGTG